MVGNFIYPIYEGKEVAGYSLFFQEYNRRLKLNRELKKNLAEKKRAGERLSSTILNTLPANIALLDQEW